ncbi:basic salivary proline-rich protein 2-like [Drosophila tropicalis]|uniref:basic salivary proline-rich protein 2-like n=1 Tax=Drosophila tropicalis TaxID=46794 RepID=UPI0035AB790A
MYPSLPAGKRREIDNVMKKARANTTNDYWDKKLIEAEEKDPNRWRHTGYKKMYIQGESSSGESERDGRDAGAPNYGSASRYPPPPGGGGGGVGGPSQGSVSSARYGRSRSPHSRSRSRLRKSPPLSPPPRRRSPQMPMPMHGGRGPRSPRSPNEMMRRPGNGHGHGGVHGGRPRSPPEPNSRGGARKPTNPSRSPLGRRRSPPPLPPSDKRGLPPGAHILPRSKRPPSPPPRHSMRSRSNSSMSSSSDDSCSLCSPSHRHRSRSRGPRSPPPKPRGHYRSGAPPLPPPESHGRVHGRPTTPPTVDKYREAKMRHLGHENYGHNMKIGRSSRHSPPPEDPRLKHRPPEPPEPATGGSGPPSTTAAAAAAQQAKKKKKEKELRPRIKIEGEKRKKPTNASGGNGANSSSDSDDSGGSDSDSEVATNSLPTFSATTRLTLSERFGKMAQWSKMADRSNMENMRITKDSAGGALKVMIEEGLESPPRRYSYSPAPAGHFPEELATTAPSGMLSWDDVRVRYEYYKSRGYLRDLDLKDYIKWEEWWYKYQEWLKQERYYEYWDLRSRRRRKKLPVTQRLN